jgi:adenylosuccinate lyase
MEQTALHSISAVDGRYWNQTEELSHYFSEFALIRYRLHIEVEYFIALCELPLPQLQLIDKSVYAGLRSVVSEFNDKDASAIKEIEKVTNHDVKAVEYFLREKFDGLELGNTKSLYILDYFSRYK